MQDSILLWRDFDLKQRYAGIHRIRKALLRGEIRLEPGLDPLESAGAATDSTLGEAIFRERT